MAKRSNVIPFPQRNPAPKKVFKDKIAARTPSASVCGCGRVIPAGRACTDCR